MSLLKKVGGALLGGLLERKSSGAYRNELAAQAPFSHAQKQAMSNLYTQRATEDPRLAAQRQTQLSQELGRPRLRDMTEQFSANVGRRFGTGSFTPNSGAANQLSQRMFENVYRQGGLNDLAAVQGAYQSQMGNLSGGLGMQNQYMARMAPGMADASSELATSPWGALAGVAMDHFGNRGQRRQAAADNQSNRQLQEALRNHYMRQIGVPGSAGQPSTYAPQSHYGADIKARLAGTAPLGVAGASGYGGRGMIRGGNNYAIGSKTKLGGGAFGG